jgi:c-di-GMP-binding flagellar brake protein YcgR
MTFTHLRDQRKYHGTVRDISQGGLRFLTSERLGLGEVINIAISGRNVETRMRAVGQVIRVAQRGHDYEIGVRFAGREREVRLSDRRRHKRVIADFEIRYRREGRRRANVGRVRDISQGGIRFVATERIQPGEVLYVMLDARAASVIELEMKATLRVTGAAAVLGSADLGDRYEIRARFV